MSDLPRLTPTEFKLANEFFSRYFFQTVPPQSGYVEIEGNALAHERFILGMQAFNKLQGFEGIECTTSLLLEDGEASLMAYNFTGTPHGREKDLPQETKKRIYQF